MNIYRMEIACRGSKSYLNVVDSPILPFCWVLSLVLPISASQLSSNSCDYKYETKVVLSADGSALPGFSGNSDIEFHRWVAPGQPTGAASSAPDMVHMAQWAMHYLVCNPQKQRGYECRFDISPLNFPPAIGDDQHDKIAVGDTESRMDIAFIYMREMSGLDIGKEIEDAIRKRLISYLREDGLCWCSPRATGSQDTQPAAMSWTTSHLLISTLERYQRTGDRELLGMARKMVDGLKSRASWHNSMAYYEGGLAGWRNGQWLTECNCYYPVLSGLVLYWKITHESDVLDFIAAMAEGTMAGLQPHLGVNKVLLDGTHSSSNGHLTTRGLLGVLQIGQLTGNARYVEFVRRAYQFNVATGTDWGWYPENILERDRRYYSETCFTGDMTEAAVALAGSGYPEYWDHIERTVKNYLRESQFFITPEFRALYRKVNPGLTDQQVDTAMKLLEKFEGGFLARQTPNDWVYTRSGTLQMSMMGCCPPEGMKALYLAWANTVIDKGENVYVNMSLDRDCDSCQVKTFAPGQGRTEIHARKQATFYLRLPAWAVQKDIQVFLNDNIISHEWATPYLRFKGIKPGDVVRVDYQLPDFTQRVAVGYEGSKDVYSVHWIGNDVIGISPEGAYLPIFNKLRRTLPPLSNPQQWTQSALITDSTKGSSDEC